MPYTPYKWPHFSPMEQEDLFNRYRHEDGLWQVTDATGVHIQKLHSPTELALGDIYRNVYVLPTCVAPVNGDLGYICTLPDGTVCFVPLCAGAALTCNPICVTLSGYPHVQCETPVGPPIPAVYCDAVNGSHQMCWNVLTSGWDIDTCAPNPIFNGRVAWLPATLVWFLFVHAEAGELGCFACWNSTANVPANPANPTVNDCPPRNPADWAVTLPPGTGCVCTGGSMTLAYGVC